MPPVLGHLHRPGCATPPMLCCPHLSYQEKVLELARPQLALVPLGYSVSLLLWDPHGPGTQLPLQGIVWQVRVQGWLWRGDRTSSGRLGSRISQLTPVLLVRVRTQPWVPRANGSQLDQLVSR